MTQLLEVVMNLNSLSGLTKMTMFSILTRRVIVYGIYCQAKLNSLLYREACMEKFVEYGIS